MFTDSGSVRFSKFRGATREGNSKLAWSCAHLATFVSFSKPATIVTTKNRASFHRRLVFLLRDLHRAFVPKHLPNLTCQIEDSCIPVRFGISEERSNDHSSWQS